MRKISVSASLIYLSLIPAFVQASEIQWTVLKAPPKANRSILAIIDPKPLPGSGSRQQIQVDIFTSDTNESIATRIASSLNAYLSLPSKATADGNKINLSLKDVTVTLSSNTSNVQLKAKPSSAIPPEMPKKHNAVIQKPLNNLNEVVSTEQGVQNTMLSISTATNDYLYDQPIMPLTTQIDLFNSIISALTSQGLEFDCISTPDTCVTTPAFDIFELNTINTSLTTSGIQEVPAPLPILGVYAFLRVKRKLRQRTRG